MDKKLIILWVSLVIIIAILLVSNVFFALRYFSVDFQLNNYLAINQTNNKIKTFYNIFVEKVLKSNGQVSYEDRLKLEYAVINTKNQDIINQWHKLLESTTEEEAQQGVKELLTLLGM